MIEYLSTNWLEVLGTIVGLIYLWLELKASIYLWIAGFVMPAIYIVVYYQAGLYADFGIQIYYLLAAFYGLVIWYKPKADSNKEIPVISLTPRKTKPMLWLAALVLWVGISTFLDKCTDSNVPYYDGFTTALSIVGLWMLSRKYIEQWIVWAVVDAVCFGLYIYKGIYATSMLYGLYTIIAIFGYFKWKRMMQ